MYRESYRARNHRIRALSLYNRLAREKVAKAKREKEKEEKKKKKEKRKINRTSHKG